MKETLNQYLDYLNNNVYPNEEVFIKLQKASQNDSRLEELLYQLPNASKEEREELLNDYLNNKENKVESIDGLEHEDLVNYLRQSGLTEERIEFVLDKLELYSNYPELMDYLDDENKSFFEGLLPKYKVNQEELGFQKVKVDKKAGFVDVLVLSIVTGFIGGIFTIAILLLT